MSPPPKKGSLVHAGNGSARGEGRERSLSPLYLFSVRHNSSRAPRGRKKTRHRSQLQTTKLRRALGLVGAISWLGKSSPSLPSLSAVVPRAARASSSVSSWDPGKKHEYTYYFVRSVRPANSIGVLRSVESDELRV